VDPLNKLQLGITSRSGSAEGGGAAEDNRPGNLLVVIFPDGKRLCYNKHALRTHLERNPSLPGVMPAPCKNVPGQGKVQGKVWGERRL